MKFEKETLEYQQARDDVSKLFKKMRDLMIKDIQSHIISESNQKQGK